MDTLMQNLASFTFGLLLTFAVCLLLFHNKCERHINVQQWPVSVLCDLPQAPR